MNGISPSSENRGLIPLRNNVPPYLFRVSKVTGFAKEAIRRTKAKPANRGRSGGEIKGRRRDYSRRNVGIISLRSTKVKVDGGKKTPKWSFTLGSLRGPAGVSLSADRSILSGTMRAAALLLSGGKQGNH